MNKPDRLEEKIDAAMHTQVHRRKDLDFTPTYEAFKALIAEQVQEARTAALGQVDYRLFGQLGGEPELSDDHELRLKYGVWVKILDSLLEQPLQVNPNVKENPRTLTSEQGGGDNE